MEDDDLERLRIGRNGFRRPAGSLGSGGKPAFVGKVVTTAPAVGKFVVVNPVPATGDETDSGAGTLTLPGTPASVLVYIVGPGAPATGDYLICRRVNYRWVAEGPPAVSGFTMSAQITATCPVYLFPFVAVTITGPSYSQTQTTNGSGQANFTGIVVGTTYTATYSTPSPYSTPRWVQTSIFTPSSTGYFFNGGWAANTAGGYICSGHCNVPISNRMTLVVRTNSLGTVTETITLTPGPGASGFSPLFTPAGDVYSGVGASGFGYTFYYSGRVAAGFPRYYLDSDNPFVVNGPVTSSCPTGSAFAVSVVDGSGAFVYSVAEATPVP